MSKIKQDLHSPVPRHVFTAEVEDHLQTIRGWLPALEQNPGDLDLLQHIRRSTHTLKGASAMMGLEGVAHLTGRMEDVLDRLYDRQLTSSTDIIPLLGDTLAGVEDLIAGTSDAATLKQLYERFAECLGDQASPADSVPTDQVQALNDQAEESIRVPLEGLRDLDGMARDLSQKQRAFLQRISGIKEQEISAKGGIDSILGELATESRQQDRLAQQVRVQASRLRKVPLASLGSRMERIAKSVAQRTQKQVEVILNLGEIGLDKSEMEKLTPALLHLLRNAVDHGIEPPEQRVSQSKPACGKIVVEACVEGHEIILEVRDDGAGLDRDAICRRAAVEGNDPGSISKDAIKDLICQPGFTTRQQASAISGRGLGLDIVRAAVEDLHGSLDVDSVSGQGTTVTLRWPLKQEAERVVLLRDKKQVFALRLDAVRQVLRSTRDPRSPLPPEAALNDRNCPVRRLSELLGQAPNDRQPWRHLVIVNIGAGSLGLAVEEFLGVHSLEVKSLGNHLQNVPGVSGVAVLEDGGLAVLLDPAAA